MSLSLDITTEKTPIMHNWVKVGNWYAGRTVKPDVNQADLLSELESKSVCTRWDLLVDKRSIAHLQYPRDLYVSGLEMKEEEQESFTFYGIAEYPSALPYFIGEEVKISSAGTASIPWLGSRIFSIGCPVSITSVAKLPESLERRLEGISQLSENWNSYSASRISSRAIEKAKSFLIEAGTRCDKSILEGIFIAPCSDGGVQLEWKSETEQELIIKISPSGEKAEFLLTEPTKREQEGILREEDDWDGLLDKLCKEENLE